MAHRERSIDTGDATLRLIEAGEGPAVVLIHGWALDSGLWAHQIAGLSEEFRVLAYDRRGFGASSGTPSLAADVLDLGRVLDALAIERASIVGMSQGARVAARFAAADADRVDGLVLDGPPALFSEDELSAVEIPMADYRRLFRERGIEAVRHAWLDHPLTQLRTTDPEAHATLRAMIERYSGDDLRASLPEPFSVDPTSVRMPVLIVNGSHDLASRLKNGMRLEQLLSRSRRVLVPDAGHLPCLDNPAVYNESLRSFLREEPSAHSARPTPGSFSKHQENRS